MEDHFKRVLGTHEIVSSSSSSSSADAPEFIATKVFNGRKAGYLFKQGGKGLGYYYDPVQKVDFGIGDNKKRKREDDVTAAGDIMIFSYLSAFDI